MFYSSIIISPEKVSTSNESDINITVNYDNLIIGNPMRSFMYIKNNFNNTIYVINMNHEIKCV